jgi:prepilin-type N-terminal cleavage/methylation domain-containing protein
MKKSKARISNTSGFTLIELLIVVLLLTVLSAVVIRVINSAGVQGKARDSQRIGDLKGVQTALELYFTDHRTYPTAATWTSVSSIPSLVPGYINALPSDPLATRTGTSPCSDSAGYLYRTTDTGSIYVLTALMEVPTSAADSKCSDLFNWTTISCDSPSDSCYGVQNP